jgi:hypothetical protein
MYAPPPSASPTPPPLPCRLDMKPRGGGRRQDASRVVRREAAPCRAPAADVFSPAPFPSAREQADATGGTRPSCCSAAFANRSIRATGGCHPYACPRGAQIGISAGTGQPGKVGYNGGANGSRTLCHAVASSDRLIAGGKNCWPPGSLPAKPLPGHPHPASANGRHRLAPSYEAGCEQDTRGSESGDKSGGCTRMGARPLRRLRRHLPRKRGRIQVAGRVCAAPLPRCVAHGTTGGRGA